MICNISEPTKWFLLSKGHAEGHRKGHDTNNTLCFCCFLRKHGKKALRPAVNLCFLFTIGAESGLVSKLDNLISEITTKAKVSHLNVGDLSLNAIKKMIAEKGGSGASDVKGPEVKGHPKPETDKQNDVSLDSLLDDAKQLLRKYKPKSSELVNCFL